MPDSSIFSNLKILIPIGFKDEHYDLRSQVTSLIKRHGATTTSKPEDADIIIFDFNANLVSKRQWLKQRPRAKVVSSDWIYQSVQLEQKAPFQQFEATTILEKEKDNAQADDSENQQQEKQKAVVASKHSGRVPYTIDDKKIIIRHLAYTPHKPQGLIVCQELEALNPRHSATSYQTFIRDNYTKKECLEKQVRKFQEEQSHYCEAKREELLEEWNKKIGREREERVRRERGGEGEGERELESEDEDQDQDDDDDDDDDDRNRSRSRRAADDEDEEREDRNLKASSSKTKDKDSQDSLKLAPPSKKGRKLIPWSEGEVDKLAHLFRNHKERPQKSIRAAELLKFSSKGEDRFPGRNTQSIKAKVWTLWETKDFQERRKRMKREFEERKRERREESGGDRNEIQERDGNGNGNGEDGISRDLEGRRLNEVSTSQEDDRNGKVDEPEDEDLGDGFFGDDGVDHGFPSRSASLPPLVPKDREVRKQISVEDEKPVQKQAVEPRPVPKPAVKPKTSKVKKNVEDDYEDSLVGEEEQEQEVRDGSQEIAEERIQALENVGGEIQVEQEHREKTVEIQEHEQRAGNEGEEEEEEAEDQLMENDDEDPSQNTQMNSDNVLVLAEMVTDFLLSLSEEEIEQKGLNDEGNTVFEFDDEDWEALAQTTPGKSANWWKSYYDDEDVGAIIDKIILNLFRRRRLETQTQTQTQGFETAPQEDQEEEEEEEEEEQVNEEEERKIQELAEEILEPEAEVDEFANALEKEEEREVAMALRSSDAEMEEGEKEATADPIPNFPKQPSFMNRIQERTSSSSTNKSFVDASVGSSQPGSTQLKRVEILKRTGSGSSNSLQQPISRHRSAEVEAVNPLSVASSSSKPIEKGRATIAGHEVTSGLKRKRGRVSDVDPGKPLVKRHEQAQWVDFSVDYDSQESLGGGMEVEAEEEEEAEEGGEAQAQEVQAESEEEEAKLEEAEPKTSSSVVKSKVASASSASGSNSNSKAAISQRIAIEKAATSGKIKRHSTTINKNVFKDPPLFPSSPSPEKMSTLSVNKTTSKVLSTSRLPSSSTERRSRDRSTSSRSRILTEVEQLAKSYGISSATVERKKKELGKGLKETKEYFEGLMKQTCEKRGTYPDEVVSHNLSNGGDWLLTLKTLKKQKEEREKVRNGKKRKID